MRPAARSRPVGARQGLIYLCAAVCECRRRASNCKGSRMTVFVTGAAGFIGFHTSAALLRRGERVIGVDSVNDYYSVALKRARLAELAKMPGFEFQQLDLSERGAFGALLARHPEADRVIH